MVCFKMTMLNLHVNLSYILSKVVNSVSIYREKSQASKVMILVYICSKLSNEFNRMKYFHKMNL